MAEETTHFFKLNVNHSVSVRFFKGDRDGAVLNPTNPIAEVAPKDLKIFKQINKEAILQGLIIEVPEVEDSWETANALSDADIAGLLGNFLKLKNTIEHIDSLPILGKLMEAAKEKGSSNKVIALINKRIEDVTPETTDTIERGEMVSSYDEGVVARR